MVRGVCSKKYQHGHNLHEYFGSRSREFELDNLLKVRRRSRLKNICLLIPVFHNTGDILCHKHICKCIYKCSCLCQLNDFFELVTQEVLDDKTCTDLQQKWHILEEMPNKEALLLKELVFEKADAEKEEINSRKSPSVTERRNICVAPYFARGRFSGDKQRKLFDDLQNINHKQYAGGYNKN